MKTKSTILELFTIVTLCIFLSINFSLYAQTTSYSCKQAVNGVYNGKTSVITIEYLPNGSVKATRTVRNSTRADSVSLYNLTSDSSRKVGNKAKLKLAANRWFIPF